MKHKSFVCLSALLTALAVTAANEPRERMESFLRNEMATGGLGALCVAYEQHGVVRYEFHEGVDPRTPMQVASITKIVTAVLLTQLVEEGKLCYNDSVQRYVPLFPTNNVTILHLMTHSSGWRTKGNHSKEPVKAEKFYGAMFRETEPGERFQYVSACYDILGEVIERVTGEDDVAEFARRRVFEPLGMKDTKMQPHIAKGGMTTTTADLVRLGRELLRIYLRRETGILTPEGADALFHPVLRSDLYRTPGFFLKSGSTGFGQYFSDLNSFEAVGHSGASGCNLLLDPKLDAVQVIFTAPRDPKDHSYKRVDGNFSRINAMMISCFGDHVAPDRR